MSRTPRRPGIATWILLSVLLGVVTGLFFGERVAWMSIVGDVFVGLLQMTVLPYIVFALIANIGSLQISEGRKLTVAVLGFLGLSWAATLFAVLSMPAALPPLDAASFFSAALIEEPEAVDFVGLFVPSNPFHSLANNIVPAVVLFSVCVGAAVMTLAERGAVVRSMSLVTEALGRVNGFLVKLTPFGVFAIMAHTAGTMRLEELQRLQVYLLIYSVSTVVLGLVVLPGIVAGMTSFGYRQILSALRVPLITAFATGKVFIVLPMLIESSERLFRESYGAEEDGAEERMVRTVVPLIYPFPHAGKLMALLFVPFTAWFVDQPLGSADQPLLLGAGLMSFFGSPLAAIPFLLELMELPADMFQLFVISGVYASRLGDALGAIHIVFVSVLSTAALTGRLRWKVRQLVSFLALTVALWGFTVAGTRSLLAEGIQESYDLDAKVMDMKSLVGTAIPVSVRSATDVAVDSTTVRLPVLERVRRNGLLRVGLIEENLPLSYRNSSDELVGLDVDMAKLLGMTLRVPVQIVAVEGFLGFQRGLEAGTYDVFMSGIVPIPDNLGLARYAAPHATVTAALVTLDHRRDEFVDCMRRKDFSGLTVGVFRREGEGRHLFANLLPGASQEACSVGEFFEGEVTGVDALLWPAEMASAWTLLHPEFSVVPLDPLFRVPSSYAAALDQEEFVHFLDRWLGMITTSGQWDRLWAYWVLGQTDEEAQPRWSLGGDVLGWWE